MLKGGYTGKILRVNLTDKSSKEEKTDEQLTREYIGGAGFGIKYLFDEVPAGADPLGLENKLIFAPGPFTGTNVPCASRIAVTAKSPLTGAVGMALSGGDFPAELKFAGYDALIIEGKASEPLILWIKDGEVKFRSAKAYRGTRTFDCQQMIKDDLRDQNIRVACIGPAGENISKMACIINERRAIGRKGLGAVMGSKNLKAIAVRGTNEVPIADQGAYKEAVSAMRKDLKESPVAYPMFSVHGSVLALDTTSELGIFSTKNWTATGVWDPVKKIGMDANQEQKIGRTRCYNCPVGCSQLKLARGGEYAGVFTEGPEYETLYSLGGNVGIDNLDAVIAADRLCDELGLDTISAGVAVGFAMELYEKGILTDKDTGGIKLNFGNDKALMALLLDMAYKRGLGAVLTDGTRIAAEKIGQGTDKYAMHIKGLEMPAYDVRGAKAHGLNYATSYTGADHNRGYAFQEIFGVPVPEEVDRFVSKGKGKLTKWNQDMRAATCDCPTICAFMLDMAFAHTALKNTAAVMKGLTGLDLSEDEVYAVGERVNNLARAFNVREGFTRDDDHFPERLLTEPIQGGNSKGQYIKPEEQEEMLDEYYEARGWTPEGVPTAGKLDELNLGYAAALLKRK
ncbi:MAG TPA: ABC transporter ATP-binding protein [Firmicutes bacterium]|nr:ABC transporter ATP-binding protein [Bacillota bacterium]